MDEINVMWKSITVMVIVVVVVVAVVAAAKWLHSS
jgi:hypothetical protein